MWRAESRTLQGLKALGVFALCECSLSVSCEDSVCCAALTCAADSVQLAHSAAFHTLCPGGCGCE